MNPQVAASLDFKVTFDFTGGHFIIEDLLAYDALGIDKNFCGGFIKITGPDGNVYHGSDALTSKDIVPLVATVNSGIPLPLGADGKLVTGPLPWVFSYTVVITEGDFVHAGIYPSLKSFAYSFVPPTGVISIDVDTPNGVVEVQDQTSYGPGSTLITRALTVNYPQDPHHLTHPLLPPVSTSTNQVRLTYPLVYTGNYSSTLLSSARYSFENNISLTLDISSTENFTVFDYHLCEFYCCMKSLFDQYTALHCLGLNRKSIEDKFTKVGTVVKLVEMAYRCSREADVAGYIAEIKDITGFTAPCKCAGGDPVQVIPVLSGNSQGPGLPDQTGQDNKFLSTKGLIAFWQDLPALADTPVVPGKYVHPSLTVDQKGRITAAEEGADLSIFKKDIPVSLSAGKPLGKYKSGDIIPSKGLNPEQVFNLIAIEDVYPTYVVPVYGVTQSAPVTGEVGETLINSLTAAFIPNDGGPLGVLNIVKSGVVLNGSAVSPFILNDPVTRILGTIAYQVSVSYNKGIVKTISPSGRPDDRTPTVLPTPDAPFAGQLDALSGAVFLTGCYKIFYGDSMGTPHFSPDARGLPFNRLTSEGNSFSLNTGTDHNIFSVAMPDSNSLDSVFDATALNADITSQYVMKLIMVDDAGGIPVSYKLYSMFQAVRYLVPHIHNITIK